MTDVSDGDAWRRLLRTPVLPPWLESFLEDPDGAVDAALREEYDFGSDNRRGSVATLLHWARALGDEGSFVGQLDAALERWVSRAWASGAPSPDDEAVLRSWSNVFDLIAFHRDLPEAASVLRDRFPQRSLLGVFRIDENLLRRYLRAVARTQRDRTLEPFWRTLASLPAGVSPRHASLVLEGFSGMPRQHDDCKGGFRPDVAGATFAVAEALERLSDEGIIDRRTAEAESREIGGAAMAAYPFRKEWIAAAAARRSRRDEWRVWLGVPALDGHAAMTSARIDGRAWADRSMVIAEDLRVSPEAALRQANELLEEQRSYARASWNSSFVEKSLTSFASALFNNDPERALAFAAESLEWGPDNPYCHAVFVQSLALVHGDAVALPYAWRAAERFGENRVIWDELGQILRRYGALQTAEEVFSHSVFLFPDEGPPDALEARRDLQFLDAPIELPDLQPPEVADPALARSMYLTDLRVARSAAVRQPSPYTRDRFATKLRTAQERLAHDLSLVAEELLAAEPTQSTVSQARDLADRYPAQISLAYVHARLDRSLWRGKRLHDAATQIGAVVGAWDRLVDREPQLAPLRDLGQTRALLGVQDGLVVEDALGAVLRSLSGWVSGINAAPEETPPFEASWAASVEMLLGVHGGGWPSTALLRLGVTSNGARLDALEESFAFRVDAVAS